MNKNEIHKLEITSVTAEGAGVGKLNGMAVFVPKTAPGDIINCKIVKNKKTYAFGIVDSVINPSENRMESDCEVFGKCGGCVYRHINYNFEATLKAERVKETISRIGGYTDFNFDEYIKANKRNEYRNKAQIPLGTDKDGKLIMGFYGKHSHRIVDTLSCPLQPAIFNKAMGIFRNWHNKTNEEIYNSISHKGNLRHLYLRYATSTDELMVCLVSKTKHIKDINLLVDMLKDEIKSFKTLIININNDKTNVILGEKCINIYGEGFITDTLCGLDFRISPLSFYQVNHAQAEKLYLEAKKLADLNEGETLIDLYCGTGTIGLCLTDNSHNLIGIEIVPQAVEDAKKNAILNGRDKFNFICADASEGAKLIKDKNPKAVVVDPPRKGLDPELIKTIAKINPQKIVYISCDVATLARDLKLFKEENYELKVAKGVDLFPATAHTEAICLLEKC
ncbi:MAG: 23S rRNA (uracil(1939)-C(5))-methyltransferase RlmD [Clostridia bacterium]